MRVKRTTLFQRKGRSASAEEVGVRLQDLRATVSGLATKADARQAAQEAIDLSCIRMDRLRDDAIRALNLMVQVGALTRAQINAAVNGKKVRK